MEFKNRKVIFIGGTSYSGSTFIDMIIGNDPNGFSSGEIMPLLFPYKKHHLEPRCGCGEANCNLWNNILKMNAKSIYLAIFEMFPHINFIVDSSKDPFWIETQSRYLRKNGIKVKNCLIWKTPLEYATSCRKRNRKNWQKNWINYHKKYFSIIRDTAVIKYNAFVGDRNQLLLKNLCEYLDIEYYDKKSEYWGKKHHILFGNNSAKIHLYNKDSQNYRILKRKLETEKKKRGSKVEHQTIMYNGSDYADLAGETEKSLFDDPEINKISDWLGTDIDNGLKIIKKRNTTFSYRDELVFLKRMRFLTLNAFRKRKR